MTAASPRADAEDILDWLPAAPVDGFAADWLMTTRLMTADIRQSLAEPVSIRVRHAAHTTVPESALDLLPTSQRAGWLREIYIGSATKTLVHAFCFVPATTLTAQPWIKTLGEQPLGAELAKRPSQRRTRMHFQSSSLTPSPFASDSGQWARRSVFDIDGEPLLLIEHLTQDLLAIPRQLATQQAG